MSDTTRSTWWTPVDRTRGLAQALARLAHQGDRLGEDHPDRVAQLVRLLVGRAREVQLADRCDGHPDREVDRLICEGDPLARLGLLHELGHRPLELLGVAAAEHVEGKFAHLGTSIAKAPRQAYTPSRSAAGSGCGLASASATPASIQAAVSVAMAASSDSPTCSTSSSHPRNRSSGSFAANSASSSRGT